MSMFSARLANRTRPSGLADGVRSSFWPEVFTVAGEALVAVRRPLHIAVDGEYLKTAMIELRADEPTSFGRQEVTLDEINKFERKFNER
jgi:hypothetical protein